LGGQIKEDKTGGTQNMHEISEKHQILAGKPEGRRPLGRPRRKWEDNIKTDLKEVGYGLWTGLVVQDRVEWRAFENTVTNL
jgi:hypothetical protein